MVLLDLHHVWCVYCRQWGGSLACRHDADDPQHHSTITRSCDTCTIFVVSAVGSGGRCSAWRCDSNDAEHHSAGDGGHRGAAAGGPHDAGRLHCQAGGGLPGHGHLRPAHQDQRRSCAGEETTTASSAPSKHVLAQSVIPCNLFLHVSQYKHFCEWMVPIESAFTTLALLQQQCPTGCSRVACRAMSAQGCSG